MSQYDILLVVMVTVRPQFFEISLKNLHIFWPIKSTESDEVKWIRLGKLSSGMTDNIQLTRNFRVFIPKLSYWSFTVMQIKTSEM